METDELFETIPAFESYELKHKSERELFDVVLTAGETWTDAQRELVASAYELGAWLHVDDRHRGQPYTYHFLRNAARAVAYLEVTDPDLLIAIILHDSVEDRSPEIVELGVANKLLQQPTKAQLEDTATMQSTANSLLGTVYGEKAATIIAGMTNAPSSGSETLTYEEKIDRYVTKVTKEIINPDVWIAKFVDWIDNGVGVLYSDLSPDSERIAHFRYKYGRLIEPLEQRYRQDDIQARLSPSAKAYVEHVFRRAEERLLPTPST